MHRWLQVADKQPLVYVVLVVACALLLLHWTRLLCRMLAQLHRNRTTWCLQRVLGCASHRAALQAACL